MNDILTLEFSLFFLIACGFLLRKLQILKKSAEQAVTDLVISLVLPCNILVSFLSVSPQGMAGDMLGILLVSVGIQVLSVLLGKLLFRKEVPDRQVNLAYGMICSNAGFLGNPVAEGVFGAAGLMLASIYLIPQRIMMWSEGLALYSGVSDRKATLKKVLTHPCVVACFAGILLMLTGLKLPGFIMAPLQTLSRCNTALSMLVIGMILSEIDLKTLADPSVLRYTLYRLVLFPLLIWLMCMLFGISRQVTGISVLLAAMPAGATTSMLSAKYGRDPQFATKMVIFSTLCSIPAIFVWSLLLA